MKKTVQLVLMSAVSVFGMDTVGLITPLPITVKYDLQKAKLGQKLFSDPFLSKGENISCETCHQLDRGGVDGLRFSFGHNGQEGIFNSPTVFNARYNFVQFWDGRAKDLKAQAHGPLNNPIEMAETEEHVVNKLIQKDEYKKTFEAIYADGVTMENLTDAIAEFEKALVTPNAPFDRFLRGDENAISAQAKTGYRIFCSKGCISCHHGIGIGGNHFNKFGIMQDANLTQKGREGVTGDVRDRYYFKVPSLRNVALTAPYFHDGRTQSLYDAVKIMSYYQLGRQMSSEEIKAIVAFLETLSGERPKILENGQL